MLETISCCSGPRWLLPRFLFIFYSNYTLNNVSSARKWVMQVIWFSCSHGNNCINRFVTTTSSFSFMLFSVNNLLADTCSLSLPPERCRAAGHPKRCSRLAEMPVCEVFIANWDMLSCIHAAAYRKWLFRYIPVCNLSVCTHSHTHRLVFSEWWLISSSC